MAEVVIVRADARPTVEEFAGVLERSGLAARRPVEDRDRLASMLAGANLVVTAWDGDDLVGIARSLTDRVYVTYLADLAVARSHQSLGIGRRLVHETVAACDPGCRVVLLAAPAAADYYPRLGFDAHPSAWVLEGFPRKRDEDHGS